MGQRAGVSAVVSTLAVALALGVSLAPAPALAQSSTLAPFTLRGRVILGTPAGRRPLSFANLGVLDRNVPGLDIVSSLALTQDDRQTPEPYDGSYTGQVARDHEGTLLQYDVTGGWIRLPTFAFQDATRTYAEQWAPVTAPATGDRVVDFVREDLCSFQVAARVAGARGRAIGLHFTASSVNGDVVAGFSSTTESPLTDPQVARGYVRRIENGHEVLVGETLLKPVGRYVLRGSMEIAGYAASEFGPEPIDVTPGQCHTPIVIRPVLEQLEVGRLSGSLALRPDPSDPPGASPVVTRWIVGGSAMGSRKSFNIVADPAPSGVTPFSAPVTEEGWRLGAQAALSWSDGRLQSLTLPSSPVGGFWTPMVPLPAGPAPQKGLYPDISVRIGADEEEVVRFDAPMAYLRHELALRGCAKASEVWRGRALLLGESFGDGAPYVDEDGRQLNATTGLNGARASVDFKPNSPLYELAAVAGPWREDSLFFSVLRGSEDRRVLDHYEDDLRITLTAASRRHELAAGRAATTVTHRQLDISAVNVTFGVRNEDGSPRPFRAPQLHVADVPWTDATGLRLGTWYSDARGSDALATSHRVTLLGLPGTVTIDAEALVPQNPDGTGPENRSGFPALRNVRLRPPRADGSCAAVCLEVASGEYFDDDERAPVLTLAPAARAPVGASSIRLAGLVEDESPIASITANGSALPLASSGGGASFDGSIDVAGVTELALVATDRCGGVVTVPFSAPVIDAPAEVSVAEGEVLRLSPTATDREGDAVSWGLASSVPGASPTIDAASGAVAWDVGFEAEGERVLTLLASDGRLTASKRVLVHVARTNRAPVLESVGVERVVAGARVSLVMAEGETLSAFVVARDPDGTRPDYFAEPLPAGAALDAVTGELSWTASFEDAGEHAFVVEARDGEGGVAAVEVRLTVLDVNRPPAIEAVPVVRAREGEPLVVPVSASDPDGDPLVFDATPLPRGAVLVADASVGIEWTPRFDQAGEYEVGVVARDPSGAEARATVRIVVEDANRAPVIEPIAPQVTHAQPGSFLVVASDPDGDRVACDALQLPPGASFDVPAQRVSWTEILPEARYVARVRCTDGKDASELDVVIDARAFALVGGCDCATGVGGWPALLVVALAIRRRRARR